MTLSHIIRVIRRWPVVVLSVPLVTIVALAMRAWTTPPMYEAQAKLQITMPQGQDVALYNDLPRSTRDEVTVQRNNFTELLRSREVQKRTVDALGLSGADASYALDVRLLRDSDYVYVVTRARTPQLAEQIANAHAGEGIAYFGETRAKPLTASKTFISEQLSSAEKNLSDAEQAFNQFKVDNGITTLEHELITYRDLVSRLQLDRDLRQADGPASRTIEATETLVNNLRLERERAVIGQNPEAVKRADDAIARYQKQLDDLQATWDPTVSIDSIIKHHQNEISRLVGLEPEYSRLEENVTQARSEYDLLKSKYTEAVLKENNVKTTSYIQVVEPAYAPVAPMDTRTALIIALAAVAALVVGVLLALVIDRIATVGLARALDFDGAAATETSS